MTFKAGERLYVHKADLVAMHINSKATNWHFLSPIMFASKVSTLHRQKIVVLCVRQTDRAGIADPPISWPSCRTSAPQMPCSPTQSVGRLVRAARTTWRRRRRCGSIALGDARRMRACEDAR